MRFIRSPSLSLSGRPYSRDLSTKGRETGRAPTIRLDLSDLFCMIGVVYAFQKPFRVYPSLEPYDNIPLPPDWREKAEWVQARMMYPQHPEARFGRYRFGNLDWREGGTSWTQDYPRADRHFALALR